MEHQLPLNKGIDSLNNTFHLEFTVAIHSHHCLILYQFYHQKVNVLFGIFIVEKKVIYSCHLCQCRLYTLRAKGTFPKCTIYSSTKCTECGQWGC